MCWVRDSLMATWITWNAGERVAISGHMNDSHCEMKRMSAALMVTGRESGSTIETMMRSQLAPSVRAASM